MGARFLAITLVLAGAWYAWRWQSSMLTFWAALLRVVAWSFLAALAGKTVGILAFRARRGKTSARAHVLPAGEVRCEQH